MPLTAPNRQNLGLETIVHAHARHVHLETGAIAHGGQTSDRDCVGHGAQVYVEIFEFGAPVKSKRDLRAPAQRPAVLYRALAQHRRNAAAGRSRIEACAPVGITASDIG